MNRNLLTPVRKSCAMLLLLTAGACRGTDCPPSDPITRPISVNGHRLTVEFAATGAARACGLSLRDVLPANHGMLFVNRDDRVREFWMKDTFIPLSIAYLDADGRIVGLHAMDPDEPERRYRSSVPARYALETHSGWFRTHGIEVGDPVDFRLPAELVID